MNWTTIMHASKPSNTNIAKRIKRHVIGRTHDFFVVTSPGMETACLDELRFILPDVESLKAVNGGIEFQGRLPDCYLANLKCRTAGRILMRIRTFKATNFRQLEKKTADIPWELYLPPGHTPEIHASTRHCRLYHKEAIAERLLAGINGALAKMALSADPDNVPPLPQQVFIRGEEDRFTVSIDSSGSNLYKRGLKKHRGKAPLRETIAAAALLLANYTGDEVLVDPLCGTGTFSLEAALIAKRIPPGWQREFAFMGWPAFRPRRWEFLKQQCEADFAKPLEPLIFASDTDHTGCLQLEKCIHRFALSDAVQVSNTDFFDLDPAELTDKTGLITVNPPYGRRLGNREESEKLFLDICRKLQRDYKGWQLILVAPSQKLAKKAPFNLTHFPISHGGLKLVLLIGKIGG